MPNITVIRSHLFEAIGKDFTDKEFDELCFEFGVEIDDVETEVSHCTQYLDILGRVRIIYSAYVQCLLCICLAYIPYLMFH
jgi:Phe-tRNA synthetase beta subunit B1 domain